MIKINRKVLLTINIMYIYIPIVVFLIGFIKLPIAISCALLCAFCIWKMYNDYIEEVPIGNDEYTIHIVSFIIISMFILGIMYLMGHGGYRYQNGDFAKHNGILIDLIKKDWPVYYINNGEHSMLSYYIAQYLVPALVGKICHKSFEVGQLMLFIWAYIGVLLVYINMLRYVNVKKWYLQIGFLLVFLFFLGMQHFGKELLKIIDESLYEEHENFFFWNDRLQYSSGFVLVMYVFQQTIVSWLVVLMFLEYKDKIEDYVPLALPLVLFSVFPFVGMLPILIGYAIYAFMIDKDKISIVKKILSVQNMIMILSLGVIFILYLYGNVLLKKPENIGYKWVGLNFRNIYFLTFMVMPYIVILYFKYNKNILYYLTSIILLILPLMYMGKYNDLMMRASIPALFIWTVMIIIMMNNYIENREWKSGIKNNILMIALIICMVDGAITPIKECISILDKKYVNTRLRTMEVYADRSSVFATTSSDHMVYNYFAYDIDDNIFYKYIARTKDKKYKTVKSGKIDTSKRK